MYFEDIHDELGEWVLGDIIVGGDGEAWFDVRESQRELVGAYSFPIVLNVEDKLQRAMKEGRTDGNV